MYLCDDGKDPQKRKWCQRMGAGVEYVAGRSRSKGETNGKSANLNNCLMQLYPETHIIPHNELVPFTYPVKSCGGGGTGKGERILNARAHLGE